MNKFYWLLSLVLLAACGGEIHRPPPPDNTNVGTAQLTSGWQKTWYSLPAGFTAETIVVGSTSTQFCWPIGRMQAGAPTKNAGFELAPSGGSWILGLFEDNPTENIQARVACVPLTAITGAIEYNVAGSPLVASNNAGAFLTQGSDWMCYSSGFFGNGSANRFAGAFSSINGAVWNASRGDWSWGVQDPVANSMTGAISCINFDGPGQAVYPQRSVQTNIEVAPVTNSAPPNPGAPCIDDASGADTICTYLGYTENNAICMITSWSGTWDTNQHAVWLDTSPGATQIAIYARNTSKNDRYPEDTGAMCFSLALGTKPSTNR